MVETRADIKAIRDDVSGIRSDLSYIRGRLDTMPTATQLILFAVAIFVAAGVTRFFGH